MTPLSKGRMGLVVTLVLASLAQAGLAATLAFCVQRVFDSLLASREAGTSDDGVVIAAVFVTSALTAALLETYRSWAGEKLGLGYVGAVREELFERLMHGSPAILSRKRQGGLLLPFVGDLTAIKKWVSDGFVRLISATTTGALLLTILALQNPALALAAATVMAVAACAVLWLSAPLNAALRETRYRRGAVANFVSSTMRAAQTVQVFNRFSREANRLKRRNEALVRAGLRLAVITGATAAIVHLAAALLVAMTLVVGVIEVRNGGMTVGLVAASISIAGLLAGVVRDLGVSFELWRRAKISFAKVESALGIEPAVAASAAAKPLAAAAPTISFEAVSVDGVLDSVTAEARPGAVVNVTGDSGAGKSTLLALAARMRDPDMGRVRVNGRDLRRVAIDSVRRSIGVASAATPLLRGSIAMNLRYRSGRVSDEEIERVVQVCNLDSILERFPDRERARLGEGAPELSTGEAQRIMIARAMVGRPSILILDDVDSHLDAESAASIAGELRAYEGTVLMTSSSPVLRRAATEVWRLQKGRLIAELGPGTPIDVVRDNKEDEGKAGRP